MVTGALTRGRAAAERLMTDTARITRPGAGDPVFDPETGGYTDPPPTTVYEGKCRVRPGGGPGASQLGGQEVTVYDAVVSVPTTSAEILPGDRVEVTAAAYDATLVGSRYHARMVEPGSQLTAHRLHCEREAVPSNG